jgi:hypothetical protein
VAAREMTYSVNAVERDKKYAGPKFIHQRRYQLKTNVLLLTAALYLALVGLGFLLVPAVMVFGALGGTPAIVIAELRQYGGALLGIAVLNWIAREAEPSIARNGVFLGNTVGFGLVAIGGVLRQLSGALAIGWVFVLINALFAIAFFIVGRANMYKSAS